MKKVLSILLLVAMIFGVATTVNAATANEQFLSYLKAGFEVAGEKLTLTEADLVKVERYLNEYPLTEEQLTELKAQIEAVVNYMNEQGTANPYDLTKSEKEVVFSMAKEAASIIDAELKINTQDNTMTLYKDGKAVETVTVSNGKLVYTGNNYTSIIVVSIIAIIAVATAIISKKKLVKNA